MSIASIIERVEGASRRAAGWSSLGTQLRLALAGTIVGTVLAFAGEASAAGGRADYDLDDDTLIEINDLEDLDELRNNADGSTLYGSDLGCPVGGCFGFELTQDLDLSGLNWEPIAAFGRPGSATPATFDGNGHTIHNLEIGGRNSGSVGLFAELLNAIVEDLGIESALLLDNGPSGVLAGIIGESTIVRNCHTSGESIASGGTFFVGGLVGECRDSEIEESSARVDVVAGDTMGGLLGGGERCSITRSFATGRVQSAGRRHNGGGLVGMWIDGTIQASFATGNVVNVQEAGGLLGTALELTPGANSIINSFATGRIIGPEVPSGGLIGLGVANVVNSYWAIDLTGQMQSAGTGAQGYTVDELQCPQSPSDPACVVGLYAGWGAELNSAGQPAWSFGTNQQLPGLNLQGVVFRDTDGDATLDASDDYPELWAASSDIDGDGAHDRWKEGCDADCRQASGVILDNLPNDFAAFIDLDLDGQPDSWNPNCDAACRSGSGLTLDTSLNDLDNDFITDPLDTDDDGNSVIDIDEDSDSLVDVSTLVELHAMRYDLDGSSRRLSEGGASDFSGCPPVLFEGVLVRRCQGYALTQDLDFDANGNGTLADDPFWNGGAGWQAIGHADDDPESAFDTVFDGNGFTIYNLMTSGGPAQQGLFGHARDAVIRHLGLSGELMAISTEGGLAGGVVGDATRVLIRDVYSTGLVECGPDFCNGSTLGGLVGTARKSTIIGSLSTADVTAASNCGTCRAGGLVGTATETLVAACFATGAVDVPGTHVGGLLGEAGEGTIVSGCYSTGSVYGDPPIGGLIGMAALDTENSYWATDTSGQNTSAGNATGATLAELQCPEEADAVDCASVPLYVAWGSYLDEDDNPYWDFGDSSELPGLCLGGTLYRDADGDGALEEPIDCFCTEVEGELLTNQGFESNTAGWVGSFGTSISSSTLQAHTGSRSLRIANRNLATWQGAEYNLLGLATPGETLQANLWARVGGDPSEPVQFTLRSTCQGSGTVYTAVASATATNTGWVQLTGSVEVPDCTLTELAVYAEGPRTGVVLYIDDVSVTSTTLVCEGDEGPLGATFVVTNDWGSGYCVELRVTNSNTVATSDWSAMFDLNGTTINDIWNLDTTGNNGSITVSPNEPWGQVLDPGASSHSLGFCATRPPGNTSLPSQPVATGAF